MIVLALLTLVDINLGLCVLFFVLYSIFRKQPSNMQVYAPRLVVDGKAQRRGEFNLESLRPTPEWVRAFQSSEEELLASCGLDVIVLMRIFIFRASGRGGVIRNEEGHLMSSYYRYFDVQDSFAAEAMALTDGLEICRRLRVQKIWIECDSNALCQIIKKGQCPNIHWKCSHIHREENSAVNYLANKTVRERNSE